MAGKKTGLGRGLRSLIPTELDPAEGDKLQQISVEEIFANPYQPRSDFDEAGLQDLAASIREHGILEPLLLRRVNDGYELVAGERRWRAAKLAGLATVPALVRLFSDSQAAEIALIENIQRKDLGPMEEAAAYQRLILEFGYKQETLAEKVGKSRPHIANTLRLLQLPPEIQNELTAGTISMGHARALLPLKPALQLVYVELIKAKNISVRQLEEMVQQTLTPKPAAETGAAAKKRQRNAQIRFWESRLKTALQAKVRLRASGGSGKIEISYFDEDDLQRLLELLTNERQPAEQEEEAVTK